MVSAEDFFYNNPSPIQAVHHSLLSEKRLELYLKRDDLLHPVVSGNKWRKLKFNLIEAHRLGQKRILTFGGAYSNHIHALADAGKQLGLSTIGVIRGEPYKPLNPTLSYAEECGMKLHYVSREQYREKSSKDFIDHLKQLFGDFFCLPEGGRNQRAVRGCAALVSELNQQLDHYDVVCAPCGTGTTLAGIVAGLDAGKTALGFAVLKQAGFLHDDIDELLHDQDCRSEKIIVTDYHFGGYAKLTAGLVRFKQAWEKESGVILDFVYTAKMMYGLFDLIRKDYFSPGTRIVAVHTGGLQGNMGMERIASKKMENCFEF